MADTYWEFNPIGSHFDGTTISSAVNLTATKPGPKILIQALDQNVRYTLDGTTPTASKGFQLKAGDPPTLIYVGYANVTLTVIQEAATADIQYQWGN